MGRMYYISDGAPGNQVIGGVARYPSDDGDGHHDVARLSRDIVDRFIASCKGQSLSHACLRALARRLTASTGGETVQNINMLYLLQRLLDGEPIRDDDPLYSELLFEKQ